MRRFCLSKDLILHLPICILASSPRSLSSREFLYPYYLFILFSYRFCLNCFLPPFLLFTFLFIVSALLYYVLCFVSVYPLFMSSVCLSFVCVCLTGCFLQASAYLNSHMLYFLIFISQFTQGLFPLWFTLYSHIKFIIAYRSMEINVKLNLNLNIYICIKCAKDR